MGRIADRFRKTAAEGRAAFIPFIMAGDPDLETSLSLMRALPAAGADIIELGAAFSDPVADGPVIQAAGLRALKAGQTLRKTLEMVRAFRQDDGDTPVVLMGYYNPIHAYGPARFARDAAAAGLDGLIVVDLPPEEAAPLAAPAREAGLDLVRLATPTTDDARMGRIVEGASGFLYYVSIAGVTGRSAGETDAVAAAARRLKKASALPVAVGFGVKTVEKAREFAHIADGVVVGSALVERLAGSLKTAGGTGDAVVNPVLSLARDLAEAVRAAREE